jgi:crotonobetainyl-CoA:carnitine CoA-transferase CaiB-like acyl-CoA transferase
MSVALANWGKRSIAVDLHTEAGKAVLDRLLETADVFLTNFRPGALERLEHSEAILLGLEYSWEQIAELKQAGAVP